MTVRVFSDQAGTTAATANDNIGKVEDLSKFDSDGVSSTTGPYLSVDANGFGSADILAQGGDVVQTFTNAISDGSALVVGTSKCIFFSHVNVEAGGTLTIGPAGDMINTNGLNLVGKVVSVATTTKVLTTAEQNSIATFFAERGASSVIVNDETVYDVNNVEADVVLDFTGDSFYRNVPHYFKLGGTYSTFADAFMGTSPKLTYSTAAGSNSTMTQGYGPELFEFGSWTAGTGWSVVGETLVGDNATGNIDIPFDTEGRVLVVTYTIADGMSGDIRLRFTGTANNNGIIRSSSGTFTEVMDTTQNSILRFVHAGSGFTGTISHISVREAPKIVWAPHNLVDYSEDFSNAAWVASNTPVLTHQQVDPDGGGTATKIELDVNDGLYQFIGSLTGDYTFSFWVKGDSSGVISVGDASSAAFDVNVNVTTEWTLVSTGSQTISGFFSPYIYRASGDLATVYVAFAHLYRSDLGGMHPVPGAVGDFQYYVPTNGNPEYLPRVGHHVYNGTTWVNEGLLIESEARSNLIYPSGFPTAGTGTGFGGPNNSTAAVDQTGPDGLTSATTLTATSTTTEVRWRITTTQASSTTYTLSFYAKAGSSAYIYARNIAVSGDPAIDGVWWDVSDFSVASTGTGITVAGSQSVGNGWYRCYITATTASSIANNLVDIGIADTAGTLLGTSGETGIFYGAQLEAASTPSSYMPTNGGTYTRTAQSLEVPPAEFGWPEPEYIGPELLDNGDFSLGDNGDWTSGGSDGSSNTFNSGVARLYGNAIAYQAIPTVAGKVYYAQWEVTDATTSGDFRIGTTHNGTDIYDQTPNGGVGSYSVAFVATSSTTYITLKTHYPVGDLSKYTDFDNISVREINPLSVSIQMDGRMTYADDDTGASATFVTAGSFVTGTTYVIETVGTTNFTAIGAEANTVGTVFTATGAGSGDGTALPMTAQLAKWGGVGMALDTHDAATGGFVFTTDDGNTEYVETSGTALTPGINVPFNISSRHGSTFVNGAVDGAALPGDTTPTALPDLSGTNLQIAYDFMGTVATFRQFAGDIGDTGLVTATKPSTEPTLSLTFDGTNGSFYNLNWSE